MIAALNPASPDYKGFWHDDGFPGRAAKLPAGLAWQAQRERWRAQIEELTREFKDGDGRVFRMEIRHAEGAIAPLTRIHEWLALARKAEPSASRDGS